MHACIKFMNLSSQSSCKSLHRSCKSSFINYFSGYCQYKDCFKVSDTRLSSQYMHITWRPSYTVPDLPNL